MSSRTGIPAKKPLSPRRRSLLAKIHIGKKQLGFDDVLYREILEARYGKDSAAALSDRQLVDLAEHFKSLGFKAKPARFRPSGRSSGKAGGKRQQGSKAGNPKTRQKTYQAANTAEAGKMRALWLSLYHLGVVRDPSEKALTSYARRVTGGRELGLASLTWIRGRDAWKVIEGLKKMGERAGVNWSLWRDPRRAVIMAQLTMLSHMSTVDIFEAAPDLAGLDSGERVEPAHLDTIIQDLGALVRQKRDQDKENHQNREQETP